MTGFSEQVALMPNRKTPEAEISRRLKSFYESVQEEKIPDKFLDLLEQLDAAEEASAGKGQGARENKHD
jgi:hypothetical protein